MSYSRHYRPALKSSVDVQLQTAFSDGNWPSVIRLADKRAKSLKDPYYEAIKVCAESQLESPAESYAVLFAVHDLVRNGTVTRDLDTIELYEWACADLMQHLDYSETFGLLRLRWVKANPKSTADVSCLQACLQHWDLVNAQKIAAIVDKSSIGTPDRRFLFWSVTLTYLLSTSPQCPDGQQKLYALLALKQLERAAEATAKSEHSDPERGLKKEEELNLYYRLLAALGSEKEILKQVTHTEMGAMSQFSQGRKYVFLLALDKLESMQNWDLVYDFCRQGLSHQDDGGAPSFLAADWRVWRSFIAAASKKPDAQAAYEVVRSLLSRFVSTKAPVAQMYKRNVAMALLETIFRIPQARLAYMGDPSGLTPRVAQLCLFLDQNFDRLSAFEGMKDYVEQLSFEEAACFVQNMIPKLIGDERDTVKGIQLKVLELKFRYLLTTCPQTVSELSTAMDGDSKALPYRCRVCGNPASMPCKECLKRITFEAATTCQKINSDARYTKAIPSLDKDPRIDLSMLAGLSLLKLGGSTGRASNPSQPPLQDITIARLLQAVLVLDTQLGESPDDVGLRLLLVQLYLLLGCTSYAYRLWAPLDVKRTIQDALSPLFFDRISSLSPGLFQGSRPLMEPLRSYYTSTLRDPCPHRIWDAFSSGSYTSIIDMTEFDSRLRRSCTLVMTVVEERHATRALGGRLDTDIDDDPLVGNISDTTEVVNAVDYGSFTSLESRHSPPVQDLVRLGPALSSTRSHLALLTERMLDVITHKPVKEYKPSKPHDSAAKDDMFNIEMLSRIHNSTTAILHDRDTPRHLTAAEHTVYTITALLSGILAKSLSQPRSSTEPLPASLGTSVSALKSALSILRTSFLSGPPSGYNQPDLFHFLTNMHTLSSLRDVALAIRYSAAFVFAWHERETVRDRSGRSGCHKDVMAEMKALDGMSSKALADVKGRIRLLKERLAEPGWLDRLLGWTFGAEEQAQDDEATHAVKMLVGGRAGAEEWAGLVVESWTLGVRGWASVKME